MSDGSSSGPGGSCSPPATRTSCRDAAAARPRLGSTVEPLPDEVELPPEDGGPFADNALPKARRPRRRTGRPAIADDSGIEAAALGGAPGVRSARYAGETATRRGEPREAVREVPAGSGLRYVCALAYVDPGPARSGCSSATAAGGWPRERAGPTGSATTRCSFPRRDGGRRTMAELSTPRRTRSAIAAVRRARSRWLPVLTATGRRPRRSAGEGAHGRAVGRLELGADPAQGGRRDRSPARSRSSPRRSTRASTWSPRSSRSSRSARPASRPTRATATATRRSRTCRRRSRAS